MLICVLIAFSRYGISQSAPQLAPRSGMVEGVEQKLVELALQNPDLEVADHQIKIAEYQLKGTKKWWLNNIVASSNINEFTIKRLKGETTSDNGQLYPFYPFYNIGVSIPIGNIFSRPNATKAAREQVAVMMATRSSKYREIKASVLSAYQDYQAQKALLTLANQNVEASYNIFLQAKEQFRSGNISINEYNASSNDYTAQLKLQIGAAHDFNLAKIELEKLIGVPIESVLPKPPSSSTPDSTLSQ